MQYYFQYNLRAEVYSTQQRKRRESAHCLVYIYIATIAAWYIVVYYYIKMLWFVELGQKLPGSRSRVAAESGSPLGDVLFDGAQHARSRPGAKSISPWFTKGDRKWCYAIVVVYARTQKLSQWDSNGYLLHVIYDDLKISNKNKPFDSQYFTAAMHGWKIDYLNKLGVVLPIIQNSPLVGNI